MIKGRLKEEEGKYYFATDHSDKKFTYVFLYKEIKQYVINYMALYKGEFLSTSIGTFNTGFDIKEATGDQIEHFEQCKQAGKYVTYIKSQEKELFPIY